jgi:integrase
MKSYFHTVYTYLLYQCDNLKSMNEQIGLFLSSIKSKETKHHYTIFLQKWIDFIGTQIFDTDKAIENKIIEFILQLREEGKSYAAINNYLAPIKLFYGINDVVLNVKKIDRFMPEQRKKRKYRPYTHEQILKILSIADERMKVVILLMASSGVRIGALPSLRLKHLQDNMLTVYEHDKDEYVAFITPECSKAIDFYIDMRSRYGEKISDESLLIREQFDIRNPAKPKPVNRHLLQYKLYDLCHRSGIDKTDVKIAHGFRSFHSTQLVESNVKTEYRWLLEGHKLKGNDGSYVKPTSKTLQQEYEKAINNLTIDPANRLRRKVEVLQIEKSELEMLTADVAKLKKMMKRKSH